LKYGPRPVFSPAFVLQFRCFPPAFLLLFALKSARAIGAQEKTQNFDEQTIEK
jgi:hypothetical protein